MPAARPDSPTRRRAPLAASTSVSTLSTVLAAAALSFATAAHAAQVEVLHYWTSGGEAKSAQVLKQMLEKKGDTWVDFAVAGGGGGNAMTALKTRVVAGNPPAAAQIKGPAIHEWGDEGVLMPIDDVAKQDGWDRVLPPEIAAIMKYNGQYVGAPVNVHRVNWLWINADALKKVNAQPPATWDDFFRVADALKKAGITPVAIGGQPWQEAETFETVALGVGGAAFYKKAFVQLDDATLKGPTMVKALETFRRLRTYADASQTGRDWNMATAMVINGQAAMQFMGDWAKGEFTVANKVPGKDYLCVAAPGSQNAYTFNVDSFVFFKVKTPGVDKGQKDMAGLLMSPAFQQTFNLNKGSIPVRQDLDLSKFDACAKKSSADFKAAGAAGALVPSWAHDMVVSPAVEGAFYDVIGKYWSDESMTAQQAANRLAAAAKTQ
ncbi:ABC transporter substrate-binding protein [Paraburkholderia caballeronis]|uniref:Probable sugar-binding periplasmic protein n=1 Tax=Paraburkholderia caballeronis TaxID=416943 RepID=A0A1H7LEI0_9BURK|nr:ABC transporter substrate-binding protein [Paraburkholderia caballeronis]PXW28429.1 carbohydrate ABC transporter substrate-binding protein (CUT1 family) [Paraburkholderia caballeronis]PXX03795.1 carbohydrate ABC transporter substrate-binding protein (CUT1 family) [Paraburkholderia caballeronis]RAK04539.1 carbohydrate ABC transporter substrate-binding protein (CUT1 family) [Paraburkholderia caballeronis]TDV39421.1 carbohydrate ABC transporter substrate-binding protein (CUT1 family) [Paraburkh